MTNVRTPDIEIRRDQENYAKKVAGKNYKFSPKDRQKPRQQPREKKLSGHELALSEAAQVGKLVSLSYSDGAMVVGKIVGWDKFAINLEITVGVKKVTKWYFKHSIDAFEILA